MKAMILAAGLGTRLKPFTDHHPKALAPVNGKTLLQRNIEYLAKYGITDLIVNVHHFAGQIIDTLKKNNGFGSTVAISDESNAVLETGGGLKKASWFFEDQNEPFVVMNADVLTDLDLERMILQHKEHQPLATLAVSQRATSRYFLFNAENVLCGWKNKKTGGEIISRTSGVYVEKAFSGIQIVSPRMLPLITQTGKFSLVDVYLRVSQNNPIECYDHTGSVFIDAGKPENIVAAESHFS